MPAAAGDQPLLQLRCSVLAERFDEYRRQRHGALAARCLRLAKLDAAARACQRSPDVELAPVKFDVAPLQRQELVMPWPHEDRQGEQRVQPVPIARFEEALDLCAVKRGRFELT